MKQIYKVMPEIKVQDASIDLIWTTWGSEGSTEWELLMMSYNMKILLWTKA